MKHSSILLLAAIIASGCPSKPNDPDDAGALQDASSDIDASSTADAGECTPTSATDEPDNASVDANCDGIDGDASDAVFVAAAPVGDDAHDGTRSSPVATLGRALQLATTGDKSQVLVAEGIYLGAIAIVAGVSIYGDYRPSEGWNRPQGAVTTIQSDGTVVIADDIDVATRISRIDIRANDALAASPNSIAVIVRGSTSFSIEDGEVRAGRGFDGESGQTPAQPAQGPTGTTGRGPYVAVGCSNAQAAGAVASGSGGSSPYCDRGGDGGRYDGNVIVQPTLGKIAGSNVGFSCLNTGIDDNFPGSAGRTGAAGSGGPLAPAIGTISSSGYALANGVIGQGGSLGGGGDGGGTFGTLYYNDCTTLGDDNPVCWVGPAGGGGGGAGGLPGLGGTAGQGGGASIGVLAWQSTIRLVRVTIVADDGGDAGDGAAGGMGGLGGVGGPGGPAVVPCSGGQCCSAGWASTGIPGGNGGNGGNGGGGSGGTGGPSIGIVLGGGANVDSASPPVISTGSGGAGGAGGTPTNGGATGPVHTILTVP